MTEDVTECRVELRDSVECDDYEAGGQKSNVLAARPLHQLPFYHGTLKELAARRRLLVNNEFLLFLDCDNDYKITLAVRDRSKQTHLFAILQNERGYFAIDLSDFEMAFYCIDHLVDFYRNQRKPIPTRSGGHDVYLEVESVNRQFEQDTVVENANSIRDLSYYHDLARDADLTTILRKDGDFLISSDPRNEASTLISVRWGQTVRKFRTTTKQNEQRYALPKMDDSDPDEMVKSFDALIKSLIISKTIIGGVQLKTPVTADRCLIGIEDKLHPLYSVDFEQAIYFSDGDYALMRYKPPIAYFLLPYYHGVKKSADVNLLIQNDGDYVLYKNDDGVLILAVCDYHEHGVIFVHQTISVSKKKRCFYIKPKDRKLRLKTVQELINYYEAYAIPVQDFLKSSTTGRALFVLKNAVTNVHQNKHHYLESCKDTKKLSYFYDALDDQVVKEMAKNGTFLLEQRDSGALSIRVYWNGSVLSYPISIDPNTGRHPLPRNDPKEPCECVPSVDEYVKSHVRCCISLNGAVLQTPAKKATGQL